MKTASIVEITPSVREALSALGMGGTKVAFTVEECAIALGIGRTMVYAEIAAGRLRAWKAGKRTLIGLDDARAYYVSLPAVEASEAA